MNTKKGFGVLGALFAGFAASAAPFQYAIRCDPADCMRRAGETARMTVTVTETNGVAPTCGKVSATLDNFGPKRLASATWDLAATNVFTIAGRLDEPGFLRLTLRAADTKPKVWGVAYEPTRIRKGSPSPDDFDAYWAAARARLAREVPLDAVSVRIPERSTKTFDFYRISFATFGRRVHGYMTVPKTASSAHRVPVEWEVNAAGFGGWTNDLSGRDDAICVRFSVYPFEPHWNWKALALEREYEALNARAKAAYGSNYAAAGISESREAYFFHPVLLGIDRAVDWVAARPDVDRARFRYTGTSQGGGFGFYLCGLNKTFTRAALFVPAITDTMGSCAGRQSGWPQIVEQQRPENRAAAAKNAPYFDGANFAARIRCPVRIAVGFADTTCPPCGVYAAYNEIPVADKAISHGLGMTHSCNGALYKQLLAWLRDDK